MEDLGDTDINEKSNAAHDVALTRNSWSSTKVFHKRFDLGHSLESFQSYPHSLA